MRHPLVASVENGPSALRFAATQWVREIRVDEGGLFGLVELLDNNPLVCADVMSVPTPAQTLALIGLGPLALAGALNETPAFVTNLPCDEEEIARGLESASWSGGVNLHVEPQNLGTVALGSAMAVVEGAVGPEEIQDMYNERFERSFFVRSAHPHEWEPRSVEGTPFGIYQLTVQSEPVASFVTVRVMADLEGKCGAAQLVHAMNVMCGFEESLGIV